MMEKKFFNLYSCCIPVSGFKKAIICDLQRDKIYPIPIILYEILIHYTKKGKSIFEVKKNFDDDQHYYIDNYFDYLKNNDCGFFSNEYQQLPDIDLNSYYEPKPVTNAIVDFSDSSNHDLHKIINELSILKCEALELRFFDKISIHDLQVLISATDGSTLRSIEILVNYDESYSKNNILELRKQYARLRKIILFNTQENKILENSGIYVIYTKQRILSENCCGVVSPWYFIVETKKFIEFKNFNSCLNRKISIDQYGNIKNCPSMKFSYGNIKKKSLLDVMNQKEFSMLWGITKDKIMVCKDCEYRYVCQDCRAYIVDENNIFSKPLKCKYDPYI